VGLAFNPTPFSMTGPPSAQANGFLCSPGGGSGAMTPVVIVGASKAGIVPVAPAGASAMGCRVAGGVTTMTFTRAFDTGVVNYAQAGATCGVRVVGLWDA
jgi:hypothetical protein